MRCRPPSPLVVLLAAALGLCACDAGHRDEPGADNRWPGPELWIQLPAPGGTVRYDVDEAGWKAYQAGQARAVQAKVELRALARQGEAVVRYAVDDQPFRALADPSKPFALPAGLAPGSHLLSAYVSTQAGTPVFGPRSGSVAEFHVAVHVRRADGRVEVLGGPSNTYGHTVDGTWHRFDRRAPQLLVERRGADVHVLVLNAKLSADTLRVAWPDGRAVEGYGTTIRLDDPSRAITLALERRVGDAWVRVPGSRAAWPMVRE